MELWWNFGGTLVELFYTKNQQLKIIFGTLVELWWNFQKHL